MQKGVRARFEIISNILSGIVQGDKQKKKQSDESQIEGAPENTSVPPDVNNPKKTKSLLPEAASTGLAFAAGALAVYFESAIKTAAEDLTNAVKKMLGFDVESSKPEEGLLVDSLTTMGATDDEKEIEKEMSIIEARPGKEDDEIFESGPNDVTTEQLTDNIENETDNAIDDNEDDTQIPDEGYFPDLDDTEKEIEENLNNAEAEVEDEDTADPIRKTKEKPRVIKEAAPKPASKKATPTSKKAGKSNTPKAKSARAAARKARPARVTPPTPTPQSSGSASSSVATGDPVQDLPNPDDDQGYPEQDNTSPAPTGTASKSLVDLIKGFEGFSPKAHPDYGQYSNGYGTKARSPTEEITKEEAERRLIDEIARFRGVVEQFSANKKYNWNSKQKDALTSFIYNLGAGALNQVTNNGTRSNSEIAQSMLLYDKAGGASLPGLTNRRKIEANVFNSSAVDEPEPTPSPAPPSGASESAPTAPTTPGAAVAAASEASEAPIKESKDVVINTPPENTSSGKTTGNQPKADIALSAGNSLARELAATHGTYSFGKTGTGTIAGI